MKVTSRLQNQYESIYYDIDALMHINCKYIRLKVMYINLFYSPNRCAGILPSFGKS